jgi:hypothetical protein
MQQIGDRLDGRAATEAVVTIAQSGDVRQLSDDELLAILAKQQAAVAATERKDDETLQ